MNALKTTVLMALLTVILIFLGNAIGGRGGMVVALLFAGMMNFIGYWYSDKIVLAMYRAREVGPGEAPVLYNVVRRLAAKAGLPMPKVYIIPSPTPNAFATGRDPSHAAVAATEGILGILSEDELEGVLGHELTHVKNRDILIGSVAATIAGAITMIANWIRWAAIFGGFGGRDRDRDGGTIGLLAMSILAPIAALLIQLAISRSREYSADRGGAEISGKPLALASALEKLDMWARRRPMQVSPSTAHMFIVNPLRGGALAGLFSTHPPTEDRVARLREMAFRMGRP